MKIAVYFDMDGVLAYWVKAFEEKTNLDVTEFNNLLETKRDEIKETLYSYDFFRSLEPIQEGLNALRTYQELHGKENVFICSAAGDIDYNSVKQAKIDWLKEYADIPEENIFIVERTVNKPEITKDGYNVHLLIDDRQKAIDAWNSGNSKFPDKGLFVGILYQPV